MVGRYLQEKRSKAAGDYEKIRVMSLNGHSEAFCDVEIIDDQERFACSDIRVACEVYGSILKHVFVCFMTGLDENIF